MGFSKAFLIVPLMLGLNGCLGLWALDAVLPEENEPEQVAEVIADPEPESEAEAAAEKQDFFGAAICAAISPNCLSL